jgi:hypothetical protein
MTATRSEHVDTGDSHPVLRFAAGLDTAVGKALAVEPAFMSAAQKGEALVALRRGRDRLDALILGVLAVAEEVAEDHAARDAAAWLAAATRTEHGPNAADAALAAGLDRRWHHLRAALAAGEVNLAQARVITDCLDALPSSGEHALDPATLTAAEDHLVGQAAHYPPRILRRLGEKILDVVAPEIAEEHQARALAEQERRARQHTRLSFKGVGDGSTRITATVPNAAAHRLRTYLDAFTSPRHTANGATDGQPGAVLGATGEGDRIPAPVKRGQAFTALLEAIDPARLPVHGGDATTVIVTIDLDTLRRRLGAGDLLGAGDAAGHGGLSAGEVRRLACTANLVPAVLGSKSEVLDLGRTQRLFSKAQRKALILRDRHCRAEGCTMPATYCEAHHWHPWSRGGNTDLADGVLLCSWHHHRAHDDRYRPDRMPNGDIRFTRRT